MTGGGLDPEVGLEPGPCLSLARGTFQLSTSTFARQSAGKLQFSEAWVLRVMVPGKAWGWVQPVAWTTTPAVSSPPNKVHRVQDIYETEAAGHIPWLRTVG